MKSKKILLNILILLSPILIFSIFGVIGSKNRKKFYEAEINSSILDSNNWQKRTTEYFLKDKIQINISVLDSVKIKVGDSISKPAKDWNYKIYRKGSDKRYHFYKNYKMDN
ncbi:hypothetical protein [Chryseobacterium sp.]|uniref:hypothetical protein n=1 Tax=Chryseobacterium sp. TaxID=1871047 RepID=UPI0012A9AF62|nr:hypothetical protein [Chryseobacterium sp.]QFG52659.1 hypothetical protein F7R58_03540 [Chryseobacterium sp.]